MRILVHVLLQTLKHQLRTKVSFFFLMKTTLPGLKEEFEMFICLFEKINKTLTFVQPAGGYSGTKIRKGGRQLVRRCPKVTK